MAYFASGKAHHEAVFRVLWAILVGFLGLEPLSEASEVGMDRKDP